MGESRGLSRRLILRGAVVAGIAGARHATLTAPRAQAMTGPAPAFPQPATTAARPPGSPPPHVVEQTLDVRLTDLDVPGYGPVTTRTYNGTIPGPTLRVRGGDTLRLTQVNGLPPNPPHTGGHNTPHRANSFNLHTHGMHVSPSGDADNVLREFPPRSAEDAAAGTPEPRYVTTVHIPVGHPAGTYWYHPHLHGSTAPRPSRSPGEWPE